MRLPIPGSPALRPPDPARPVPGDGPDRTVPVEGADRTVRAAGLARRVAFSRTCRARLAAGTAQIAGTSHVAGSAQVAGTARIAVPADGQARCAARALDPASAAIGALAPVRGHRTVRAVGLARFGVVPAACVPSRVRPVVLVLRPARAAGRSRARDTCAGALPIPGPSAADRGSRTVGLTGCHGPSEAACTAGASGLAEGARIS